MKYMSTTKIGLVILLGTLLSFSCNGKVTTRPKQTDFKFTINGVVVKDLNLGKDLAYFKVLRDSHDFDSALVKVGSDTVKNSGGGIYIKQATKLFNYGQNITILVSSVIDDFSCSTSVLMPGSFEITGTDPRDSITATYQQTNLVYVQFDLSAGATGYFMSVLQPDGLDGFTDLIPAEGIGNTHVDRGAFYDEQNNLVTGWYNIYMVAYRSSFLAYPGMIFFLPAGLPVNNIPGANGTIGAGVVAVFDSLKVREPF